MSEGPGVPEKPAALADLIDAGARAFLDVFTGMSPEEPRPWHYGREVPCAIHAALLADEYLMHGTDIAKAADILWDGDQVAAGTVCRADGRRTRLGHGTHARSATTFDRFKRLTAGPAVSPVE